MSEFERDVLNQAGLKEIKRRRCHSLRVLVLRLVESVAGDTASGGVNLSEPRGRSGCSRLIGGERVKRRRGGVGKGGQLNHGGVIRGPGERANGRGDIGALAEGVSFHGHGLALREARLLNGHTVKENPGDSYVIDGWVDENISRRAGGAESFGGYRGDSNPTWAAGRVSRIPVSGAGDSIGSKIQDGSIAGGEGKTRGDVAVA